MKAPGRRAGAAIAGLCNRRRACLFAALLALAAGGCAGLVPPDRVECVFSDQTTYPGLRGFLEPWVRTWLDSTLVTLGFSAGPRAAVINLSTERGAARFVLHTTDDCERPLVIDSVTGDVEVGEPARAALAAGLPIARARFEGRTRHSDEWDPPWLRLLLRVGALLAIALAAGRSRLRGRAARVPFEDVVILGLVAVLAWDVLHAPLGDRGTFERAFHVLFGGLDWAHPPLPFWLGRVVVTMSVEPWAVRFVPLLALVVETLLLTATARRAGGPVAGALAGAWFACEVRRRHGLVDVSDWDFAGVFVLAAVGWLQRLDDTPGVRVRFRSFAILGLIFAACLASSWMTAVFVLPLFAVLLLDRGIARGDPRLILGLAVACLCALWFPVQALRVGSTLARERFGLDQLLVDMFYETPTGRTLWMIVPMSLGMIAWVANSALPSMRFAGLALVAGLAIAPLLWVEAHWAQGYYIAPATPLLLLVSAMGVADLLRRVAVRVRTSGAHGNHAARIVSALLVCGLVSATVTLRTENFMSGRDDLHHLSEAVTVIDEHPGPIVTNEPLFASHVRHQRLLRRGWGVGSDDGALSESPVFRLRDDCEVEGGWDSVGQRFLLALIPAVGASEGRYPCGPWFAAWGCSEALVGEVPAEPQPTLLPAGPRDDRYFWCNPPPRP